MNIVARWATPSTLVTKRLSLSLTFTRNGVDVNELVVVPEGEQVTFDDRRFVRVPPLLRWMFIVGAPASEKHVTVTACMASIMLK
jgi:hypothetical protein